MVPITPVSSRALNLVHDRSAYPAKKLLYSCIQRVSLLTVCKLPLVAWYMKSQLFCSIFFWFVVVNECVDLVIKDDTYIQWTTDAATCCFLTAQSKQGIQ